MAARLLGYVLALPLLLTGCAPTAEQSAATASAPISRLAAPPGPPPPPPPPSETAPSAAPGGDAFSVATISNQGPSGDPSASAAAPDLPKELAEFARPERVPVVRSVRKLTSSSARLMGVEISGDKRCVVTVDLADNCQAWNAETGQLMSTLERQQGKLTCLVMSHDGKYSLVGYDKGGALVWENATGKIAFRHTAPKAPVDFAAVSRDSRWAVIHEADGHTHRYPLLGGLGHTSWREGMPAAKRYVTAVAPDGTSVLNAVYGAERAEFLHFTDEGAATDGTIAPKTKIRSVALGHYHYAFNTFMYTMVVGALDKQRTYMTIGSSAALPEQLQFTDDDRYLIGLNRAERRLEIRDMRAPLFALKVPLPVVKIQSIAWSSDGRRLAVTDGSSEVLILEMPEIPPQPYWELPAAFSDWLRDGRYERMEEVAAALAGDPTTFPWWDGAPKYGAFLDWLDNPPGAPVRSETSRPLVDRWLARHPESPTARCWKARDLLTTGWDYRGSGFANTVSESAWQSFAEYIEKARAVLMPLFSGDRPPPPQAYATLFEIAKAQSWDDQQLQPYIQRLLNDYPQYFPAHWSIVVKKLPRWGGEPDESEAYASYLVDKIGGAAGQRMYLHCAVHLAKYFPDDDQSFFSETHFDYPRLLSAVERQLAEQPRDTFALNCGLRFAALKADNDAAKRYAAALQALDFPYSFVCWHAEGHFRLTASKFK